MNPPLRFCFELDSLADAPSWGQPPDQYLHWYGLTSGQYWLETGAGTLFEFTDVFRYPSG